MNIAQYTNTTFPVVDGVGRVVEAYAETMMQKGHSCFVAAPKPLSGVDNSEENIEFIRFAGIPIGTTPYRFGVPFVDFPFHFEIDRHSIDIVHVHDPFSAGMAGLSVAKRRNIPVVGTFHSKYYDDFYQATRNRGVAELGVKLVIDFYKKCDEVWAVSESTAETLCEYGYDGKVIVIENGTDPKYPDDNKIAYVKKHFNLTDKPVLLFVGQMNWKKNQEMILRTAAELRNMGQDFHLIFAGQGSDFEEIVSKTKEMSLDSNTIFVGHIGDKAILDALYFSSDLFFFPSYYDNAPMVVREAAAASLPSILARGSTAAEVIRKDENGLLCNDDPKSTAQMIKNILHDPVSLQAMGKRAKNTIAVSWDTIIDKVLSRYENLIERRVSRSRIRNVRI